MKNTTRQRLLASSVMVAASFVVATTGVANAQATNPTPGAQAPVENGHSTNSNQAPVVGPTEAIAQTGGSATDATNGQPATSGNTVVVTGSRIATPNLKSISPVTAVNQQEFKLEGTTRVEDLINQLPQAFAAQNSNIGNGSTGTATVSLRNLGANRTLVLIDGRRLVPGDPTNTSGYAPDVNFIPSALVDRVEVLTGGASSTYGSDAVAGVVNFVMQKNFQGFRLDATGGFYQGDNDNPALAAYNRLRNFNPPTGDYTDGGQVDVTAVLGANSPDGKGNVTAYLGYRHQDAVFESQRVYGNCQLQERSAASITSTNGNGFQCGGSGTTSPAQFLAFSGDQNTFFGDFTLDPTGAGNTLRTYSSARDAYNYAPFNIYERPDQRYTAGAFAHYEIDPKLDVYAQAMFMDDETAYNAAPSGVFGQTFTLQCNNPLLSANEVAAFCGGNPNTTTALNILKRDVEGGPRATDYTHTDYRLVIGAKGELAEGWNYDAYLQYGRARYQQYYSGEFSVRKTANALNVVTNSAGQAVCADPLAVAAGCVPYDVFAIGAITPAALNYVQESGIQTGNTEEQVASASITGQLGQYGIKSPWANDGVGIAAGTEYRREGLTLRNDEAFLEGDLAGLGGSRQNVSGSFDVYELYGEVRAPLIQGLPFIRELSMELGYRFSDYSTAGTTNTYKIGGDWQITPDIRLRAAYNRATRAPNVIELFSPQQVNLDGSTDPCATNPNTGRPDATFAQCALTGVSASQYGNIAPATAGQYNGLNGGNPNLKPETSYTTTAGFVFTPRFVPRLSLSVDAYDIKVVNVIGAIGADVILNQCLSTGASNYCSLIHRAPGTGSLFLGNNGYVVDINQNSGYLQTQGFDMELNYAYPLPDIMGHRAGRLSVNAAGTYLASYEVEPVPGLGSYDCSGRYGTVCGEPLSKWRHKVRVTWDTPYTGVQLSANWRFFSDTKVQTLSPNSYLNGTVYPADERIGSYSYIDLAASWRIKDGLTFRTGVNNVFDVQPPSVGSNVGGNNASYNGSTYPAIYDSLGRFIFMGVTADF